MPADGKPLPDAALLEALVGAVALKDVDRAGWVRAGVTRPESVAAHSWGVAWLVVALAPPHLDRGLALSYAVVHDLAEAEVGDLTPYDGVSAADKQQRESAAIDTMCAALPHVAALWHAYEAQADDEARFVRQLDRLDMAVQAASYGRRGQQGMTEFLASARAAITDPALIDLLDRAEASLR